MNYDNQVDSIPIVNSYIIDIFNIFNSLLVDKNVIITIDEILGIIKTNSPIFNKLNFVIKYMIKAHNINICRNIIRLMTTSEKHTLNYDLLYNNFCNVLMQTKQYDDEYFKKNFVLYSVHIIKLLGENNIIFSVGDSLSKYDILFNCLIKNEIKSIIFSDSICKINKDGKIYIDDEKRQLFDNGNAGIFRNFNVAIELIKNNQDVVLVDYGCKGRLFITMLYFFNKLIVDRILLEENLSYLKFYMMTFNSEILNDMDFALKQLNEIFPRMIHINLFLITNDYLSTCLTNIEFIMPTRCTPEYKSGNWNNKLISNVYIQPIDKTNELFTKYGITQYDNYLLCNMGNFLLINYFKHIEFFMKFILIMFNGLLFADVLNLINDPDIYNSMIFDLYSRNFTKRSDKFEEIFSRKHINLQQLIRNFEKIKQYYTTDMTSEEKIDIQNLIDVVIKEPLPKFL
jgi:hypothetical protein